MSFSADAESRFWLRSPTSRKRWRVTRRREVSAQYFLSDQPFAIRELFRAKDGVMYNASDWRAGIDRVNVWTGKTTQLVGPGYVLLGGPMGNGWLPVAHRNSLYSLDPITRRLARMGRVRLPSNRSLVMEYDTSSLVAVSPDGRMVLLATVPDLVELRDVRSGRLVRSFPVVTAPPAEYPHLETKGYVNHVSWAPDSRSIAYTASLDAGGPLGLVYVLNVRNGRQVLVEATTFPGAPSWSSRYGTIAYDSGVPGTETEGCSTVHFASPVRLSGHVLVARMHGGTRSNPAWSMPEWSPDGRWLGFTYTWRKSDGLPGTDAALARIGQREGHVCVA